MQVESAKRTSDTATTTTANAKTTAASAAATADAIGDGTMSTLTVDEESVQSNRKRHKLNNPPPPLEVQTNTSHISMHASSVYSTLDPIFLPGMYAELSWSLFVMC